jgi:hypothetical protein
MQLQNPQHDMIFRAVFMSRALAAELKRAGIAIDMSFGEIGARNVLRLDLAGAPATERQWR